MRDFRSEGPRSMGPPVVWAGLDYGPALVVLDPSGAAPHEDPPATWHSLAERYQVAWCRLPASQRVAEDIEDVLETLTERQARVYLVASGSACASAIAAAAAFADLVRAVLLVDPPDTLEQPAIGVTPQVVARSHDGATDRVTAPMPLGHPEVVHGVQSALVT